MALNQLQDRNDRGMPGLGLLKGLTVTLKRMLRPAITQQYPHVKPDLPARTRGVIALKEANCTVCYKCSRACPDWCIYIDAHKETNEPAGGGKARSVKILDRFAIDYALCMYCGICVEVCPFDALFWSPEYEYAEYDLHGLLHEKEKLEEWSYTVKPPPELEIGAEPPPEPAAAVAAATPAVAAAVADDAADAATSTGETAVATGPGAGGERMAATSAAPSAPAAPKVEVAPDQAVYDRVFAEEVAKGTPERVAQGKAKRAAMLAARKAAAPTEPSTAAPAPTAEAPSAPAPTAAKVVDEPDQETYDRVFAEEVAKGTPERVAQGKAKRAAMLAARKKAEG